MPTKLKPYLLSLLATAIPNALGFLAFPLYAKALGASSYGIIALLEAYQGVLSILLFVGMTTAFYVFYSHAKEEKERQQVFATSTFFGGLILLFALVVSLFASPIADILFHGEAAASFVTIYAFALFSDYLLTLVNTYLRVEGKIGCLAVNGILISFIHHGLNFCIVVLLEGGIGSFVSIFFATKSAAVLIAGWQIKRFKLSLRASLIDFSLLKKMLKFGAPLILTALTGWVLLLSDRLFINYYVTTADVGIYAVGYKFAMGLWIGVVQPFMTVWEPSLFKTFHENSSQGYLKLKRDFTRYLAGIVTIYSAFILFIGEILTLIFARSEYTHENTIIYLLTASYFFMAIGEMWASVCRLNKTSRFAFWVTLAVMITKVVFNVVLIPNYLLIGAAVASVIAEIVSQTIMALFAVRLTAPQKLFFSVYNWVLFSLFCLTEGLLYAYPEATLLFKSIYFGGLLLVIGVILVREKEKSQEGEFALTLQS